MKAVIALVLLLVLVSSEAWRSGGYDSDPGYGSGSRYGEVSSRYGRDSSRDGKPSYGGIGRSRDSSHLYDNNRRPSRYENSVSDPWQKYGSSNRGSLSQSDYNDRSPYRASRLSSNSRDNSALRKAKARKSSIKLKKPKTPSKPKKSRKSKSKKKKSDKKKTKKKKSNKKKKPKQKKKSKAKKKSKSKNKKKKSTKAGRKQNNNRW